MTEPPTDPLRMPPEVAAYLRAQNMRANVALTHAGLNSFLVPPGHWSTVLFLGLLCGAQAIVFAIWEKQLILAGFAVLCTVLFGARMLTMRKLGQILQD